MNTVLKTAGMAVVGLALLAGKASAEEYTTTSYDPVLDAYSYTAPANSWYAAKVKPKIKMQMEAKAPVEAGMVNIPEPETVPVAKTESPAEPMLDTAIANSPVAKSPESTRALPFWQDILPADKPSQ